MVSSGNKPLHEPMLNKFSDFIVSQKANIGSK